MQQNVNTVQLQQKGHRSFTILFICFIFNIISTLFFVRNKAALAKVIKPRQKLIYFMSTNIETGFLCTKCFLDPKISFALSLDFTKFLNAAAATVASS